MLTLLEASKLNTGDVMRSAIVEMFAAASDILMALPFDDIQGNAVKYNREAALPGIGFRGVNEAYSESVGAINPITEALAICGGDLDVDRFIVQTQGQGQRAVQESLKVKALAAAWTTNFVKGDSEADPRQFDGLQVRLTGSQKIQAGATANGTALSLAVLDQLIDAVDIANYLIMSKAMRRRLSAAARNTAVSGYITYQQDQLGHRQTVYNDIPILVAYNSNGGQEVLPFTEACTSGTATGTSIYAVMFGEGRLNGIQNGGMDVRDLGELPTAPVFRTRVEWYAAMAMYHGRAAGRLWSIADAAVTA